MLANTYFLSALVAFPLLVRFYVASWHFFITKLACRQMTGWQSECCGRMKVCKWWWTVIYMRIEVRENWQGFITFPLRRLGGMLTVVCQTRASNHTYGIWWKCWILAMEWQKSERNNPFRSGKAYSAWFEGFWQCHSQLSSQLLSYCRAISSNQATVHIFFAKLGSFYGRLNLITKPMQWWWDWYIYKAGKIICETGRQKVYALTAERRKTHTVLAYESASEYVLPPMTIHPRKRCVPESVKEGAIPDTFFASESGWINSYLEWFRFFSHIHWGDRADSC